MIKNRLLAIILYLGLFLPGKGFGEEQPQSQLIDLFKKSMPTLYSYIPAINLHEWATNWVNNLSGTQKYIFYATLATALGITAYTGYSKFTQQPEIKHVYSPEFVQKLGNIVTKTQKVYDLPLPQYPAIKELRDIQTEYEAMLTKNLQPVVQEFKQIILPTLEKKESLNFLENHHGWVYLAKKIAQENTAQTSLKKPSTCLELLLRLLPSAQDPETIQKKRQDTINRLRNSLLSQQIDLARQQWHESQKTLK